MNEHGLEHLTAVERSDDILSGSWRFRGTRVPVAALFENLRDGATVAEFIAWFPGGAKAQVDEILEHEIHALYGLGAGYCRMAVCQDRYISPHLSVTELERRYRRVRWRPNPHA